MGDAANADRCGRRRCRRLLIVYAYHESPQAAENLEFFARHGVFPDADREHVFVVNGPRCSVALPPFDNVRVLHRPNVGFDFGAWAHGLRVAGVLDAEGSAGRLGPCAPPAPSSGAVSSFAGGSSGVPPGPRVLPAPTVGSGSRLLATGLARYDRFLLVNASVVGPFVPACARSLLAGGERRWFDALLSLLDGDEAEARNRADGERYRSGDGAVRLAGTTINDHPEFGPHVQSMVMATDAVGLGAMARAGIFDGNDADADKRQVVERREVAASAAVLAAGWQIECFLGPLAGRRATLAGWATGRAPGAHHGDCYRPDAAPGGALVSPLDVVLFKRNRDCSVEHVAQRMALARHEADARAQRLFGRRREVRAVSWLAAFGDEGDGAWRVGHAEFLAWLAARFSPVVAVDACARRDCRRALAVALGHSGGQTLILDRRENAEACRALVGLARDIHGWHDTLRVVVDADGTATLDTLQRCAGRIGLLVVDSAESANLMAAALSPSRGIVVWVSSAAAATAVTDDWADEMARMRDACLLRWHGLTVLALADEVAHAVRTEWIDNIVRTPSGSLAHTAYDLDLAPV